MHIKNAVMRVVVGNKLKSISLCTGGDFLMKRPWTGMCYTAGIAEIPQRMKKHQNTTPYLNQCGLEMVTNTGKGYSSIGSRILPVRPGVLPSVAGSRYLTQEFAGLSNRPSHSSGMKTPGASMGKVDMAKSKHTTKRRYIRAQGAGPPELTCEQKQLLWRRNVPYLYDLLAVHKRSNQCGGPLAWMPGHACVGDSMWQRLLVGAEERLLLLNIELPWHPEERAAVTHKRPNKFRMVATHSVAHEGPMRHLALSPHREGLIATLTEQAILLLNVADWPPHSPSHCQGDYGLPQT
eukprot:1736959-Amphidinium_carterae.1